MLNNFIKISDFAVIGDIARHHDKGKLSIAVSEAEFDLIDLFGQYGYVLIDALKDDSLSEFTVSNDPVLDNLLLTGGTYEVGEMKLRHRGLKSLVMYFIYSRYILINSYNDTANGLVGKTNEFSIPTPLKEIKDISEHYRNLAKEVSKGVIEFLCYNKDKFDFDNKSCSSCKVPSITGKVDTTRAGSSFKIIRK
ncbi:hypothetical protein [Empedobacter stercoris]|uniref:DUF6712 family protein n=1 Tax=Empedobacter stercoris TaxID=1628248 RepID=UPI0039E77F81